jgi:hypothetical protein
MALTNQRGGGAPAERAESEDFGLVAMGPSTIRNILSLAIAPDHRDPLGASCVADSATDRHRVVDAAKVTLDSMKRCYSLIDWKEGTFRRFAHFRASETRSS